MDIEITDVTEGEPSYVTEEVHFTGGLRGAYTNFGWALFPVSDDKDSDAIVFKTSQAHSDFATKECGLRYMGACIKYRTKESSPPMDVWEFGARDPQNGLGAADSWSTIGQRAAIAGDAQYAETATCVGLSLKAASLRLRDVSNGYHDQLRWALAEKRTPGGWFSNAALQDVYADFHSLASELFSARDYLAKIAAMHVGAPDRIDGMARLEDWLDKDANRSHRADPMINALLTAMGSKDVPNWLRKMGDLRNEMLHRLPMGANKAVAGLILERTETSYGQVSKIRLGQPLSEKALSEQQQDPLIEVSQFSMWLEALSRSLWKHAKYPAELLRFTSKQG